MWIPTDPILSERLQGFFGRDAQQLREMQKSLLHLKPLPGSVGRSVLWGKTALFKWHFFQTKYGVVTNGDGEPNGFHGAELWFNMFQYVF